MRKEKNKIFLLTPYIKALRLCVVSLCIIALSGCGQAEFPDARTPDIPAVTQPYEKVKSIDSERQNIIKLPLGKDILVPKPLHSSPLPDVNVGPFELRGETLGGALQLILADYDIAMAFETNEGLTRRITVANLRGKLEAVVEQVCSLANLYCAYDEGILTVKDEEIFIVDLPPISSVSSSTSGSRSGASSGSGSTSGVSGASRGGGGGGGGRGGRGGRGASAYTSITRALDSIVGGTSTVDYTTRVLVYTATHRSNKYAEEYFKKLRKNTALIIFETHIWEVTLNNENRTGIDWQGALNGIGNFNFDINVPGTAPAGIATPITITPTYSGSGNLNFTSVLQFISEHGAVKTVSQPQITVMSGSSAVLDVRQSENFVSEFTRTPSTVVGIADTVSTTTDTVETGLRMSISSAWDNSTVYGTLNISLDELLRIDNFSPSPDTIIQLPATTTRSLQTQVRVRPGDTILIAGLVTERDSYTGSGPGLLKPFFTTSRAATTKNTELVFMLKPRVIVFVDEEDLLLESNKIKDEIKKTVNRDKKINIGSEKKTHPVLSISPDLLAPSFD